MKRKYFTWFDLTRLTQDSAYVGQLATDLGYADASKLFNVLKDCTEVLLARRGDGVKDYENKRTLHINQDVLSDLPKLAGKIKKLCQSNMVEWWVKPPSFKLNFVEFKYEIDQLDLLSLLTLNHFDEALSAAGNGDSSSPDVNQNVDKALQYWETLQVRKEQWVESKRMGEVFFQLYKDTSKHKQSAAGRMTAAINRMKAVDDDLNITRILLLLLNHKTNSQMLWHSLNEFAEAAINAVNEGLLKAQIAELNSLSLLRLKSVIKEINHFDSGILGSFVEIPIPKISAENSRWKHYKIVKKWQPDLQFTYLVREDE